MRGSLQIITLTWGGGVSLEPPDWLCNEFTTNYLKILKSWSISESPGKRGLLVKINLDQISRSWWISRWSTPSWSRPRPSRESGQKVTWSTSQRQCSQGSKCQHCTSRTLNPTKSLGPCNVYCLQYLQIQNSMVFICKLYQMTWGTFSFKNILFGVMLH